MDKKPTKSDGTESREDRLKAALRANLQRRKVQARAREAGTADEADTQEKE